MTPRILVTETNPKLRCEYRGLATSCGLTVDTAATARECRRKLLAESPAVLVLDADIPWVADDGVWSQAREGSNRLPAPVIFVTGNEPADTLARRFGVPVSRCFQRPFWLMTLFDSISAEIFRDPSPLLATSDRAQRRGPSVRPD